MSVKGGASATGERKASIWVQDRSGKESKVGFRVNIKLEVGYRYMKLLNFDDEFWYSKNADNVESGETRIKISGGDPGMTKLFKGGNTINISYGSSLRAGDIFDVFIFHERQGAKNWGHNSNIVDLSSILGMYSVLGTQEYIERLDFEYNNSYGERYRIKLKDDLPDFPKTVLKFEITGTHKDGDFTINVNITLNGAESNNDYTRPDIPFEDVLTNVNYYKPQDTTNSQTVAKVEEKIGTILQVITNIGMILSVLISGILGIKYMLGSVEEKADYKKDLVPYLIGACMVFGICTIVKIIQAVGQSVNG